MFNIELLIEQLKSWGKGYIPPSAQITMDEAARAMIAMNEELRILRLELDNLKAKTQDLVTEAKAKGLLKNTHTPPKTTKTVSKPRAKKAPTK
jgi:hypothetical protein